MENNPQFWHRSRNKVIAGVCGGIAKKLNVDPVVVRLVFVLLAFFGGGGVLAYIILWIVLPDEPWDGSKEFYEFSSKRETSFDNAEPNDEKSSDAFQSEQYDYKGIKKDNSKTQLIIGLVLIGFGTLFLFAAFIPSIDIHDLWPAALIVIGLFLLLPTKKH